MSKTRNQSGSVNQLLQTDSTTRLKTERWEEILDIAADVFIRQGFESASTNDIARRAKTSKTTFYSRFPTKDRLFHAVIEHRMNKVFREVAAALPLRAPLPATLRIFGAKILQNSVSPEQVSLLRVVGMEASRFPELATRFYELGPGRGHLTLAKYLTHHAESKRLRDADPMMMAEHFISLITGGPVLWYIVGLKATMPAQARRTTHLEHAIETFLRAYAEPEPLRAYLSESSQVSK